MKRAGGTFDDRVDGFEVAWVWGESDEDRAVFEFAFDLVAEVVFDVAVACDEVRLVVSASGCDARFTL